MLLNFLNCACPTALAVENAAHKAHTATVIVRHCIISGLPHQRPAIVGLSPGAAIATDFAIVHPDLVQALVLHGPNPGL
jgi:pimeloyl-ACP methyl ester carboxylesterase